MGAKLSKKKKGYDVSDPKSKNDETPATNAAKVEDGAPSTEAESTPGNDGVVEETVVSAVAEAAVASEEPKAPSDEKAPAAKEEAAPEQKSEAKEAAQAAPAEKEKAVEAAPVAEEKPPVVEEKATVAEKAPEHPKSAPPEEPVPVATEEVAPEQKSAVGEASPVKSNEPSTIEEPVASTAQAEPEKPEPKVEEPTAELSTATAVTENASASEEPVQVEAETESTAVPQEPPAPVESVAEPHVLASTEAEPDPTLGHVAVTDAAVEEKVAPTTVPEAEPAGGMESEPRPESKQDGGRAAETVEVPEVKVQQEQMTEPGQPEPESVEAPEPEPEPEQPTEPEVEQSPEPEQVEGTEPQPTVATSDATEAESCDASDASAQNVFDEAHPAEEPPAPTEAAEPAPEVIISQSVSTSSMTVESDKVALEEVACPENKVETKLENGDLESPSVPENMAEAVPAVNGQCGDNTAAPAAHGDECVNGNENLEEMSVKELSEFELKKDLCEDVQKVPDAVSDMVEGLSTEVTQAV